jgi:hypothetical protein
VQQQKEGFNLMLYRCGAGHREVIWNSRDGITPFIVDCRVDGCEESAQHVDWHLDRRAPLHVPEVGSRIFVDLTIERARELRRIYTERHWDVGEYQMKDSGYWATKEEAVEDLAQKDLASFAPHTPDLLVVDQDMRNRFIALKQRADEESKPPVRFA